MFCRVALHVQEKQWVRWSPILSRTFYWTCDRSMHQFQLFQWFIMRFNCISYLAHWWFRLAFPSLWIMISKHGTMHWEDLQASFAFHYRIFLAIFNMFFQWWDGSYYTTTMLKIWKALSGLKFYKRHWSYGLLVIYFKP